MRSTVFVIFSIFVHAACVMALTMAPAGSLSPGGDNPEQIDVTVNGDGTNPESKVETAPLPVAAEETKVEEPAVVEPEKAPAPKKKAPAPQKIVAAPKPAELPKKQPSSEPEKLDPEIVADANMVDAGQDSDANVTQAEATEELQPVKETAPVGVEAEVSELETEAGSDDLAKTGDPAPAITSVAAAASAAAASGPGSTAATARSYLDLQQVAGNPSPKYPTQARQQRRAGQVDLLYRVTESGGVSDLKILKSSGYADLDKAAVEAVSKYKFVAGQEGWARHPVVFSLKGPTETMPSRLRSVGAQTE